MTKIDESKQYKFSEIAIMLENKELPKGTILFNDYYTNSYPLTVTEEMHCNALFTKVSGDAPKLDSRLISYSWGIKLPKEDKYYLKAPEGFDGELVLNHNSKTNAYFIGTKRGIAEFKTQFTQTEINAMPFSTNFFRKRIILEQGDE